MIIGIFLRHIKAYKGINFIPIGIQYKFVTYVGENGTGKSSILEALDSYFNGKPYPINKGALKDGINTNGNEPFVSPVFLIDKTKVTKNIREFEKISNYFWSIDKKNLSPAAQKSTKEFFELRDNIISNNTSYPDSHYLIISGEINLNSTVKPYLASFFGDDSFVSAIMELDVTFIDDLSVQERKNKRKEWRDELEKLFCKTEWRHFFSNIKKLYSYVYLPVEIEVESFTKIETIEMQKIFDKKIKNEIELALEHVNFDNQGGINYSLNKFIKEIEVILNDEYCYSTGQKRNNNVTKSDLINKIIEAYFQKRILNKKTEKAETKVSELSAGEKRQALINLIYAFLTRNTDRNTMVVIGIDEPENSLHTALCYEQFEKLKEISIHNQILITTHWYGYLPVISEGYGHFLNFSNNKVQFETYDLYDYKSKVQKDIVETNNAIPQHFMLKSTYDLVQSIFYSLKSNYNWIICEGVSEKIYFEYFFENEIKDNKLRILPVGGQSKVIRLFKYLKVPVQEEKVNGKIFCIIDTDNQRCEGIKNDSKNIVIKRLSNKNNNSKTELITLDNNDTYPTDIEMSLNPMLFQKTINELTDDKSFIITSIINENGNSDFIKNFKNLDIADYFKLNDGENKIIFAKKYIENSKDINDFDLVPTWVSEIKKFFQ